MFEVSVRGRFSAAHRIEGYDGECAAVHGHNWEVEVFVRGRDPDDMGILLDFRKLKSELRRVLRAVDHRNLNEVEALGRGNPTSERIARFVFEELSGSLAQQRYRLHRVTVHETPETAASYWQDD